MRSSLVLGFIGALLFTAGCQETATSTDPETTTTGTTSSSTTTTSDSTTTSDTNPTTFPPVDPTPFAITIQNATAESVFVHAGLEYPFALSPTDGADYRLRVDCPCTVCGTGGTCNYVDALGAAVEIPAGESLLLDEGFVFFTDQLYNVSACPEISPSSPDGTCPLPNSFPPSDGYNIRVNYAGPSVVMDETLSYKGGTQWGMKQWLSPYAFYSVKLPNVVEQPLTVAPSGPTEVLVVINP